MSEPAPVPAVSSDSPKPKKTKLTLAIVGCSFFALVAFFVLPTLLVPMALDRMGFAQRKKAELEIGSLMSALDTYAINNGGKYPEALIALVVPDENGATYLRNQKSIPSDPWGHAYVYFAPVDGKEARIVSYGKDGKPGGEGADADIDSATLGED